MENQFYNVCNFTPEIYAEYYNDYIFKKIRTITLFCEIILLINLIILIRANFLGYDNWLAILIVVVSMIVGILLSIFTPAFIAVYNYTKKELKGKEYLSTKTVFHDIYFDVLVANMEVTEYYNRIKKIIELDNITIIVMKNKKLNYVLENKGFKNGDIEKLKEIIKGDK